MTHNFIFHNFIFHLETENRQVLSYYQLVIYLDSDLDSSTYWDNTRTTPEGIVHSPPGPSLRVWSPLPFLSHYDHDLYVTGEETEAV